MLDNCLEKTLSVETSLSISFVRFLPILPSSGGKSCLTIFAGPLVDCITGSAVVHGGTGDGTEKMVLHCSVTVLRMSLD